MPVIEFSFASLASGDLTAAVRVPDSDFKVRSLDTTPMLIALGGKRRDQLELYPHCVCAEEFEEAGLCAASLDLPNHGPRIDRYGSGIDGWCAAFMSGECDPFETCIADCRALVAACKERGFMGARGNVYVYGVSRGGYMGLRWAAADDTIAGVAAMGPCTDWRPTRWWSAVATDAAVAALAIDTWAPQLASRPVYIAIGNTMMACTHQAPSSSPQPSWREKATSPPRAPPDWSCTWLRPRGTLSQRSFVELAQRGFCDRSRRRQRQ